MTSNGIRNLIARVCVCAIIAKVSGYIHPDQYVPNDSVSQAQQAEVAGLAPALIAPSVQTVAMAQQDISNEEFNGSLVSQRDRLSTLETP